jgi:hypothetical protein
MTRAASGRYALWPTDQHDRDQAFGGRAARHANNGVDRASPLTTEPSTVHDDETEARTPPVEMNL